MINKLNLSKDELKNIVKTKIMKKSLDRFSLKKNIDSYTKVFKTI